MGGGENRSPTTFTERFYEEFPKYLAMGMTAEQYWDDDPTLCKYYRKAQEIRNERRNQELWLQGMYIYEALLDVSPVIHAFAKKGTKPAPYSEKPYALTVKAMKDERMEREKSKFNKGKQYMEAHMANINRKLSPENK